MSHALMIQDWTTITGPNSGTIIQNEAAWPRCEGYQDACFYLEVSNATASAGNLYVQTSPTKDAAFFDAFASGSAPGSIATFALTNTGLGLQTLKISRWATETVQPLGRFLRWKIVFAGAGGPFSVSFRLWVTLNQAGY